MANLSGPCTVYDRTSGDEKDGQDGAGAAKQTATRAEAAGFSLEGVYYDEDLAGDSPWEERKDLLHALGESFQGGWPLVVREVSRLSRFPPHVGMAKILSVPNLEVLGRPHWQRRGGRWTMVDDTAELLRLIDLWDAWREKRKTSERTQLRMDEFKNGKPTKSGKPHHRPPIEFEPAHLEAAREVYARTGNLSEAHREMLRLRGYFEAKDPRTQKARTISRAKVGELLGVYSVRKPDVSERGEDAAGDFSIAQRPLPDAAESVRNSAPVVSDGAPAAGGASRGQAVLGGGGA